MGIQIFEYHCGTTLIDLAYPHRTKIGHFEPLCSVPRVILTLNISTIGETLIFSSGWVMGNMPYVHFFPPLSLLSNSFFKNWKYQGKNKKIILFPVQFVMVIKECQWGKKVDIGHDFHDPSRPKNHGLPDGRNVEG